MSAPVPHNSSKDNSLCLNRLHNAVNRGSGIVMGLTILTNRVTIGLLF